jgi:hypothetical protein
MNSRKELEMNDTHTHTWQPAPDLGRARYRCACGVAAYRNYRSEITAYKHQPKVRERHDNLGWGGRISPRPSLDHYDRARND